MSALSSLVVFARAHPYLCVLRAYALGMKLFFIYMFAFPLLDAWRSYGYQSFLHVAEYSGLFFVLAFVAVLSEIPWLRAARTVIDALYALTGSVALGTLFYVLARMSVERGGIG